VTGGLSDSVAGRLSFTSTEREGNIKNVVTGEDLNNLENWSRARPAVVGSR
jgi:hypothetical protein